MLLNIDLNVQPVAPAALDTRCHTVCCRHDSRSTGGRLQGRCEAACVSVGLFFAQRCAALSCRKRQRLNMSSGECMSYARQPGQSSSSWSTQVLSVCVFFQMTMCVACTCVLTRQTCSRGNLVQNWRLLNPDALHLSSWTKRVGRRAAASVSGPLRVTAGSRTSCGSLCICPYSTKCCLLT